MKKEIIYLFVFSTCFFFLSSLLGYTHISLVDSVTRQEIISAISEEFSFISELSSFQLFLTIFLRNTLISFVIMLLGIILGIVPLLFVFANGYLLGVVSYFVIKTKGVETLLLGIVPHGILEIPAAMIAAAYGFFLAWSLFFKKEIKIKEAVVVYLKVVLPLLFLAALIEAYITPLFIW